MNKIRIVTELNLNSLMYDLRNSLTTEEAVNFVINLGKTTQNSTEFFTLLLEKLNKITRETID